MNRAARGLMLFACVGAFCARTQAPAAPQQSAGLESDWEIAAVLQKLGDHAARMIPILDRADAQQWNAKGAPAAYAEQLQSGKDQARALADSAKALAGDPETLSAELQLLFREQGLEMLLNSVAEAERKYQSPAAAQELVAAAAESGGDRDRLQQYVVNLASEREKEFKVMDEETQRCRAQLLAIPPPAQKKSKK
ncbi:MAG TPA: hypothetical protein VHW09_01135 [Bryobacteraceae bacterium]|jgi:hypothetical protein|nr:hypothetical protein [Bryobacteraceae bacterium]